MNQEWRNSKFGLKTNHVPKIDMRKFDGKDLLAAILNFYLFLISYLHKGFEPLVLVAILENKTTLLFFTIHIPSFCFCFHYCKHENLEFEVMSMALKSSLDYYGYSCLCVHCTSNSIMVTQLARHQILIHFAFFC